MGRFAEELNSAATTMPDLKTAAPAGESKGQVKYPKASMQFTGLNTKSTLQMLANLADALLMRDFPVVSAR